MSDASWRFDRSARGARAAGRSFRSAVRGESSMQRGCVST